MIRLNLDGGNPCEVLEELWNSRDKGKNIEKFKLWKIKVKTMKKHVCRSSLEWLAMKIYTEGLLQGLVSGQ